MPSHRDNVVSQTSPLRRALGHGVGLCAKTLSWGLQMLTGCFSPCRFEPSCSVYAAEAVSRHGLWRGLILGAKRVGRCRPGAAWGADPVEAPR